MGDEGVIAELRVEIVRLRAALAEAMDWGWTDALPPAEVVERCEVALGISDELPAAFREVVHESFRARRHAGFG